MKAGKVLFILGAVLLLAAAAHAQPRPIVSVLEVGDAMTFVDSLTVKAGTTPPMVLRPTEFGGGPGAVDSFQFMYPTWPTEIDIFWQYDRRSQRPLTIRGPVSDEWYDLVPMLDTGGRIKFVDLSTAVAEPETRPVPARVTAAPNPFSHRTRLTARLARPGRATVGVYDAAGRPVRSLADGSFEPGTYHWVWDGTDDGGNRLAPGIYFARLATAGERVINKLVLTD